MKSTAQLLIVIVVLLSSLNSNAQIKESKTESVKVFGNCDMCKTTIEKAGSLKKIARVEWNIDTKMATLTYDSVKTSRDEILKRIALAGYDSENFLTPDDIYAKLPGCCQYQRALKPRSKYQVADPNMSGGHNGHVPNTMTTSLTSSAQSASQLKALYDEYFSIKDALVNIDATTASLKAKTLVSSISSIVMSNLSWEEHAVWMKVMNEVLRNAERISNSNDIAAQREAFAALSTDMYELAKVSHHDVPYYYQHCPMYSAGKGANWLSKENAIKNPYYGAQMLTCGSTVDTLINKSDN